MRFCAHILAVFFLASSAALAEEAAPVPGNATERPQKRPAESAAAESRSINVDMKVIYGRYNSMLSTISLSQEQENFVYLLTSYFKRSNDFGRNDRVYENSSYYENKLGFTGSLQVTDRWKASVETGVDSDSRGMFDNPVYSREEKEKVSLSLKNVIKLSHSFEAFVTAGGGQYVHRLRQSGDDDDDDGDSRLYQANAEVGGEYIWSHANRIRFNSFFCNYFYSDERVGDDRFVNSEIIDDFYLTRNIGVSVGLNLDVNRDDDALVSPIVSLLLKDFQFATIVLAYRYDMVPFRPEIFYLTQKYIMPTYDLPPSRVHRGDVRFEFRLNSVMSLKSVFSVERHGDYYNYYTVTHGNLLSARSTEATLYHSRLDWNILLFDRMFEWVLSYEYSRFDADEYITYRPVHVLGSTFRLGGDVWKAVWGNRLNSQMHTDPENDSPIGAAVIGEFSLQRKMLESFYAYIKIDNLYNRGYYLRDGYPEQGLSVLGGIRILF